MPPGSFKGFGIIADDLTGAMDAGAGFLKIGLRPIVVFSGKLPSDSSAIVISTDSRDKDPQTAYKIVRRQAQKLAGLCIYKKIDSTLRGNIGIEILAVMDALKFEKTVVCPAFPANGRTVVDGRLMIWNVPVNETSFAGDPINPITEARIPAVLQKQIGLPIGNINLEEVKKGSNNLFRKIKESEQKVVVIDAVEEAHLRSIAEAVALSGGSWLPCGSAGLAAELPSAFGYKSIEEKSTEPTLTSKPVLAVVGSRNDASIKQILKAQKDFSIPVIAIEPGKFIDDKGKLTGLTALKKEISNFINDGKSVIITTALSLYLPGLKESSARLLAKIVAMTVKNSDLAGLFLTGGDIARETCSVIGITGIRILKELEPGVIFGEAMSRTKENFKIITKAGGFGNEQTIIDAIQYLKGERK